MRPRVACQILTLSLALGVGAPALASTYQFVAAPETDLNRIYRVDQATGEVGACQFGLQPVDPADPNKKASNIGEVLCYPEGVGAGPQTPSDYSLVGSHHVGESGVYRVDLRNGTMSVCYVLDDKVVCTKAAK
ncbi:MAG: hypothetical protein KGQ46_11780 [Hyphomicrobiales bacterium]|nr:hypothetical protein [Hyphomicrobiales bacterium]MDE2113728.1 hypothetical protein [Hyphomicrobiales bacterium]